MDTTTPAKKGVFLRIPADLLLHIKAIAKREHRSVQGQIIHCVSESLARNEGPRREASDTGD